MTKPFDITLREVRLYYEKNVDRQIVVISMSATKNNHSRKGHETFN